MAKKLNQQEEKVKILLVLSDGEPDPSGKYDVKDLKYIVGELKEKTKIKIVGLGIGSGTGHVAGYYSDNIITIPASKLVEVLSDKIRDMIDSN